MESCYKLTLIVSVDIGGNQGESKVPGGETITASTSTQGKEFTITDKSRLTFLGEAGKIKKKFCRKRKGGGISSNLGQNEEHEKGQSILTGPEKTNPEGGCKGGDKQRN